MAWEDDFLYPLYLLLIGSGVLGVAVALLTYVLDGRRKKQENKLEDRRREREFAVENHRKELEIKVDLVSKINEAIAHQMRLSYNSIALKKVKYSEEELQVYWEKDREFYADVYAIEAKLQLYYPDTKFVDNWTDYWNVLLGLKSASASYFDQQSDPEAKQELDSQLRGIKEYFSNDTSIRWDNLTTDYDDALWRDVILRVRRRGTEIIKEIMHHPIKIF